ncbi:MAG: hypothetical protein HYV09_12300 [Deltaproteobacteria bacterium]|nr:hypothetical protein [Deltaproteobacteria bacterium]
MRLALLLTAAAVSASTACVPMGPYHHHPTTKADLAVGAVVGGIMLTGAVVSAARSEPTPDVESEPPAPVVVLPHPGEFDRAAAKAALRAVQYKDCGQGGSATVVLVFRSSGVVERAGVVGAHWHEAVSQCVVSRFQLTRVPPFTAERHAVSWKIHLPLALEVAPEQDQDQEEEPQPAAPEPVGM